ncbi:CRISPR-associated endonuclease Cas1 [Rubinisphaera italica]|uniref:CRISPR-associated endonuclease Cas1 n=1 Tax=Rubinisphaera italica TaxID=2527969 RepID=A0A5C5XLI3_9PLAN|nr:CRISPR-associated endonuclease Cas1 [Rubinisphaera italica]TWT63724.1 CRISPR-associated endonuclease Cas1 [Rubinisphaera italica]
MIKLFAKKAHHMAGSTKAKVQKPAPIPCCEVGVLHLFGPGVVFAPNRMIEFRGTGRDAESKNRRLRLPLRGMQQVCIYGNVRVTAGAIRVLGEAGIPVAYLSADGSRFAGMLSPPHDEFRNRRYRQYLASHDREQQLKLSQTLMEAKLTTMLEIARNWQKQSRLTSNVLLSELRTSKKKLSSVSSHESLRGIEGTAARVWFRILAELLPTGWELPGRVKRPPTDPVNALLSFGYMVLLNRTLAAIQAAGLDPALGFYHEYRPGRSSLACDLMEPFRANCVDQPLLGLLARKEVTLNDFEKKEKSEAVIIKEDARKRWLGVLEATMYEGKKSQSSQLHQSIQEYIAKLPPWDGIWLERPGSP